MINSTSTPQRWPLWTFVCWVIIAGFVAVTFGLQERAAKKAAAQTASDTTPNLPLEITGRIVVGQSQWMHSFGATSQPTNVNLEKQLQANLLQLANSPPDKLKAIIAIEEISGSQNAVSLLEAQVDYLSNHPIIRADADALRNIYLTGPRSVSAAQAGLLKDHLGWFGQLAVTQGLPTDDPARAVQLDAAKRTYIALMSLGAAVVLGLGLGFLLLILLIVLFSLGKLKFHFKPGVVTGPPVFLESFALWGLAYLLLALCVRRFTGGHSVLAFEILFVSATALIAIWQLCRGMSWPQLRHSLGWHRGRGFFIEMSAGLLGYVAGLPILLVGILITLILSKVGHANPTHPIQQEFSGPLPLSKIISLLLAISVCAPLLEESMFRGALYFHMRRRWRPWLSAGVVALIFAAIHPQGWAGIPVLASIALTLALLREWRGSLIASITAHGINNGMVLLAIVLLLR